MTHYDEQHFKDAVLGTESRHTEHCDVEYNEDLDSYMLFKNGKLVGEAAKRLIGHKKCLVIKLHTALPLTEEDRDVLAKLLME